MITEAFINNPEGLQRIADTAIASHAGTNHFYDTDLPYAFHLRAVVKEATRYLYLIKGEVESEVVIRRRNIIAACWLHDCMEDTRMNYNAIRKVSNTQVAEMVRAVTNDGRGRTREERMPAHIYADIRNTLDADYVKLCDRIANVKYSTFTESRMLETYRKEHEHFIMNVTTNKIIYAPLITKLTELLK